MGLAVVEFVMAVEQVFDVKIPDAAAAELRTIGGLFEELKRRKLPRADGVCATQAVFHRVRRAISPDYVTRSSCRPGASLTSVMPIVEWRDRWRIIGKRVGLELPALELPRWYSRLATSTVLASSGATFWAFGPAVGVALAFAGGSAAAVVGQTSLAVPGDATLGGLCRSIVERNYGLLIRSGASWRDADAWAILKGIASSEYGVPIDRISAESRLDLETLS